MTGNEYQKLAARTMNRKLNRNQTIFHALFGIASEVGELHGLHQKVYQGHTYSEEHAKKELGDICWNIAEYCTVRGWDLDEIFQINIEKLRARYPEGFDAEHSLHRKEWDV